MCYCSQGQISFRKQRHTFFFSLFSPCSSIFSSLHLSLALLDRRTTAFMSRQNTRLKTPCNLSNSHRFGLEWELMKYDASKMSLYLSDTFSFNRQYQTDGFRLWLFKCLSEPLPFSSCVSDKIVSRHAASHESSTCDQDVRSMV